MACPICGSNAQVGTVRRTHDGSEAHHVPCARCGPFDATEEAVEDLPGTLRGDVELIARVAHGVRRMQRPSTTPLITSDLVERFAKTPLPSIFEQANTVISWIGRNASGPGEDILLTPATHQFLIGAKSEQGFIFLLSHLVDTGYVEGPITMGGGAHLTLTFKGLEHFDKLERGAIESRKAFMAMKYGDEVLDRLVAEFFRPAVAQTGFVLTRLDDQPRAGLIDDRLRVEIRNSRFLIADLTHDNLGAYWEAGFAEGLDKPVIYTCERGKFKEAEPHFDTNHHLTIIWEESDPAAAAELLKATIRATLPADAKQTD